MRGSHTGYNNELTVWTRKLTKAECDESGVDESNFFHGRKHKFGLNLQAVCNHKKKFISIFICDVWRVDLGPPDQ